MTTAKQALARIIDSCQPESVAVCGELAESMGEHWCTQHGSASLVRLPPESPDTLFPLEQTQDLALITHVLEHLPREQGQLLLGQLRNYGTHRIAVLVSEPGPWSLTDFIALGFRRQAQVGDTHPATLYTYNLDSYNHKRTWNNPDYWANPEMWGKAWW